MKSFICDYCETTFEAYESTRRGTYKYCSKACKGSHQKTLLLGESNPNHKHGKHVSPTCECGRRKDYRSDRCAICSHKGFPRDKPENLEVLLAEALANTFSFLESRKYLLEKGIVVSRTALRKFQQETDISISHFCAARNRELNSKDIFKKDSVNRHSTVKNRILREELIPYQCAICKIGPIWNNAKLTIQLDHINGDSSDNRLENLRFLCPNCHSQTDTYCSRNFKNENRVKRKRGG